MQKHHKGWLVGHPERTVEWLKEMLTAGFEVHHIDGDHANNHPHNLALIERIDHRRLHGMFRLKLHTDHYKKISQMGAAARAVKLSPRKRSRIARKAALTRWRKPRLVEITKRKPSGA